MVSSRIGVKGIRNAKNASAFWWLMHFPKKVFVFRIVFKDAKILWN
jgi:hypothetical protein